MDKLKILKNEEIREGLKKGHKLGTLSQVRLLPPPSEVGTSLSEDLQTVLVNEADWSI